MGTGVREAIGLRRIDTGCVFGGSLTALVIDDAGREEIVQVRAKRQYVEPRYPLAE